MTTVALILMLQYVISTKAGLVNYVQGPANVTPRQSVAAGTPIRTGTDGYAEVLLNPGSFMRVGQNSEAVLEGTELTNVSVRLNSGTAVIEAAGFTKDIPLKVTSGDLEIRIFKDGIYVLEPGQVKIAEGQLQVEGRSSIYKKGWVVSRTGALKFSKTNILEVELWSKNRSNLIAVAHTNISNTIRRQPSLASSFNNVWLWDPSFGAFTYMPGYRYRSPYGYSYRSIQEVYYGGNSGYSNSGSSASSTGGGFSNSGGSTGGGFSGGGGGAVPASAPSPRVEPSEAPRSAPAGIHNNGAKQP